MLCRLIAAGNDDAVLGRFAADHVGARSLLVGEGHAANGSLRVFLDLCLGLFPYHLIREEDCCYLSLFYNDATGDDSTVVGTTNGDTGTLGVLGCQSHAADGVEVGCDSV